MKKIKQWALMGLVGAFSACNGMATGGSQMVDSVVAVQEPTNFSFLAQAGIDTTSLLMLPDDPLVNGEEIFSKSVDLTTEQQNALLGGALHPDINVDEHEGSFLLLAVKPLPGGFTLVLYRDSFADRGMNYIAVYGPNGAMTDYLCAGDWFAWGIADEAHPGTMHYKVGAMRFTGADSFEVTESKIYIAYKEVEYELEPIGEPIWQVDECYQYSVDDVGHILYVDTKADVKKKGDRMPTAMDADFENIQRQPMSDITRIDRLNDLAVRSDVLADLKNKDNSRAENMIMTQLMDFYEKLPLELLSWMAVHDGRSNHLLPFFEAMFTQDLVKKSGLDKKIGMMPDAKARAKMERLTARWEPKQ